MKKIDIKRKILDNVYPTVKEHIAVEIPDRQYGLVNYYLIIDGSPDRMMWKGMKGISNKKRMLGENIDLEDIPFVITTNENFQHYSHTLTSTDFILRIGSKKYAYHSRMRNVFNEQDR